MDTRIIDVALGLVLVLLLTSLLTTALQEAWSSWRGTRGKVLRSAIESFVGDDERFAQALLDHPLLVALSPQTQEERDDRRPSYIGADSLVAALIEHLVRTLAAGTRPTSPIELVDTVLRVANGELKLGSVRSGGAGAVNLAGAGTAVPGPQFARGLASLVSGVEHDWPAFEARLAAWYDAVGARSTGWFKRKVQHTVFFFGLLIAVTLNINPIVIATHLWEDEPLRRALASAAEKFQAANEQVIPASSAEGGVTGRTGAAKRSPSNPPQDNGNAAARIGPARPASVPDLTAQLEDFRRTLLTAMTERSLSVGTRAALGNAAGNAVELRRAAVAWRDAADEERMTAGQRFQMLTERALRGVPPPPAHQALHDSQKRLRVAVSQAMPASGPTSQQVRGSGPSSTSGASSQNSIRVRDCESLTDPPYKALCLRVNELAALQAAGIPIGWSSAARPTLFAEQCRGSSTADRKPTEPACEGFTAIVDTAWWGNSAVMLLGWLLTGLACTVGAPFWFDALGRLVKLRAAGSKPETASTDEVRADATGPNMLARTPTISGEPALIAGAAGRVPMSDALNDDERALVRNEVERIQRSLGLSEPEISGYFDGATRRAIQAWQSRLGLSPANGELSEMQIRELLALRMIGDSDGYLA